MKRAREEEEGAACPEEGAACPVCTFLNPTHSLMCSVCGSKIIKEEEAAQGVFACPQCTFQNTANVEECEVCESPLKKKEEREDEEDEEEDDEEEDDEEDEEEDDEEEEEDEEDDMVLTIGKHSGKTFLECFEEDPSYCDWVVEEASSASFAPFRSYICRERGIGVHYKLLLLFYFFW
jgi:hypothetical protein